MARSNGDTIEECCNETIQDQSNYDTNIIYDSISSFKQGFVDALILQRKINSDTTK